MSRQPSPTPSLAHSTTTTGSWPLASSTEYARSPAEPLTPLDAAFEVPALVIALPSLMIEAKGPRRPWEDVTDGSEEGETQVLRQAKVSDLSSFRMRFGLRTRADIWRTGSSDYQTGAEQVVPPSPHRCVSPSQDEPDLRGPISDL